LRFNAGSPERKKPTTGWILVGKIGEIIPETAPRRPDQIKPYIYTLHRIKLGRFSKDTGKSLQGNKTKEPPGWSFLASRYIK